MIGQAEGAIVFRASQRSELSGGRGESERSGTCVRIEKY